MKNMHIALAAALACTLAAPVAAAPISLNATLDGLLSNNAQGKFDASSALNGNYKIDSLTFKFSFNDDGDAINFGNAVRTDYMPTTNYQKDGKAGTTTAPNGHTVTTQLYTRDATSFETVLGLGQQESASLSLAGIKVGYGETELSKATSKSTSAGRSPVAQTTDTTDSGYEKCFWFIVNICKWEQGTWKYYTDNVKTVTTTNTQTWTGSFDITGTTTDRTIIDQLLNNKYLDFGLGLTGDLFLTNAQIDFDATEIAAEVPEPSTALLMLAALGGLGYSMRRRSTKQ